MRLHIIVRQHLYIETIPDIANWQYYLQHFALSVRNWRALSLIGLQKARVGKVDKWFIKSIIMKSLSLKVAAMPIEILQHYNDEKKGVCKSQCVFMFDV